MRFLDRWRHRSTEIPALTSVPFSRVAVRGGELGYDFVNPKIRDWFMHDSIRSIEANGNVPALNMWIVSASLQLLDISKIGMIEADTKTLLLSQAPIMDHITGLRFATRYDRDIVVDFYRAEGFSFPRLYSAEKWQRLLQSTRGYLNTSPRIEQ